MNGWHAVDLDGTLAEDTGWFGMLHIGQPIQPMVDRIKRWRVDGEEVRIFTARMSHPDANKRAVGRYAIEKWCREHIGEVLPVTNIKDFEMIDMWDDRAVTVEFNTGRRIGPDPDVEGTVA